MGLPDNFPLTEPQLANIKERLEGVDAYKGMGVAGPMRDALKLLKALYWVLNKYGKWESEKTGALARNLALTQYMTSAEAVLAGYAAGNWDGGNAASQLLNNMPQIS
jgi:hypothetical protein